MRKFILLAEIHRIRTMLLEDRMDFLRKNFIPRLVKYLQDHPQLPTDAVQAMDFSEEDTPEQRAEKLMNYVISFDPSKNKKNANWLLNIFVKGNTQLEDLAHAPEYITKYEEKKKARQLAPEFNNIERFKSLSDLYLVVRDSDTQLAQASSAEEQAALAESEVLVNNERFSILSPKSKYAACYFGRDTEWCTAWGYEKGRHPGRSNHFDHYNKLGPLWIIHDKRENKLYQFLAAGSQSQFMDVDDRRVNMTDWMMGHKDIFDFLTKLSPAFVGSILIYYPQWERQIANAIPKKYFTDEVAEWITARSQNNDNAAVGALGYFDQRWWQPRTVESLIRQGGMTFERFLELPEEFQTASNALALAQKKQIDGDQFRQLPEQSQTEEVASYIVNADNMSFEQFMRLPEHIRTSRLFTQMISQSKNVSVEQFLSVPENLQSAEATNAMIHAGHLTIEDYLKLPEAARTTTNTATFFRQRIEKDPKEVAQIPKELFNTALIKDLIVWNQRAITYLPDYVSNETLKMALGEIDRYTAMVAAAHLSAERLHDGMMQWAADLMGVSVEELPKHMMQQWASKVSKASTRSNYGYGRETELDRVLRLIPERYMNAKFMDRVIDAKFEPPKNSYGWYREGRRDAVTWAREFIKALPEDMRTPHMVAVTMNNTDDQHNAKYILQNLPKEKWNAEVIKVGLDKEAMKVSDIPEEAITPEVAGIIYADDPEKNAEYALKANDETLIKEVNRGHYKASDLYKFLPKERFTEPLTYAMGEKFWLSDFKKRVPAKCRSKRVYYTQVGRSVDLKDVPAKFVDERMQTAAVTRDAKQIKYIENPVEFMNKHQIAGGSHQQHWIRELENEGITKSVGGYGYIKDLPAQTLENGWTLHIANMKRTKDIIASEASLYLMRGDKVEMKFEVRRKKAFVIFGNKDDKELSAALREVTSKFLGGINDISEFNPFGVYRNRDGSLKTVEQDPRKEIEGIGWSGTEHEKGKLYTAWLGEQPIMKLYIAASHGWGGGLNKVQRVDIVDLEACRANADALIKGIRQGTGYWSSIAAGTWDLAKVGIGYSEKLGLYPTRVVKLGKEGRYEIWFNPKNRLLTIFNATDLIAQGVVTVKGKCPKPHIYVWRDKGGATEKEIAALVTKYAATQDTSAKK